jgi:hypothetical protein
MGKCEIASAAIGIKILLSDLILQINETNFNLIKKMLYDGCIEDSNGYYNEVYKIIIGSEETNDELPEGYLEYKEFLISQFKNNGSYYKFKFTTEINPDLTGGCLFEKELLIPIKQILETERWGYGRYGVNSAARPLDFDLSVDLKVFEEIKHFNLIFMIKQYSG